MDSCSIKDCPKPIFVKETDIGSLCNGHYRRYRLGLKVDTPLRGYQPRVHSAKNSFCPVTGCGRISMNKMGYCQSHAKQYKKTGEVSEIRQFTFQKGQTCNVDGCDKPCKSSGYCVSHYRKNWGECSAPNCTRKIYSKASSLCHKCHQNRNKD